MFLHFLGPELSTKAQKNLEVVRKSTCFCFLLSFLLFFFFFKYFCLILSGITTRFSKHKLAKVQEKKAKGGTVSGLLSKKKTDDVSKKDPVTTLPLAHSPTKRPVSPTLSLEMIASGGEEVRKKKKAGGKSFLLTFWDDADAATLKAHEALSVDDLSLLMVNSSSEVMSSHIQKLVHVCLVVSASSFSFALLLLRENFFVGFGGVPIRL